MLSIRRILYLIVVSAPFLAACQRDGGYLVVKGFAQGGTYSVQYNSDGASRSHQEIAAAVDSILVALDHSVSGYNKKSVLSRFNTGDNVVPDSIFLDLYDFSYKIFEKTSGVVDVASGPIYDLWGFGFSEGEMPSDSLVEAVRSSCGMGRLVSDPETSIGKDGKFSSEDLLIEPGVRPKLNFNAVAQGYACDLVAEYLYSVGVKDMLVDIGEIYCDGLNSKGNPWTLGIDRPVDGNNTLGTDIQAVFSTSGGPCGVVTSGNYRKFYIKDGKKISHTIDPRSGYPVSHSLLSATIVAENAALADAYATYCMVIGLDESKDFVSTSPGVEACLIYDEDGEFKTWCSDGFHLK